jgi:hypothetical protein
MPDQSQTETKPQTNVTSINQSVNHLGEEAANSLTILSLSVPIPFPLPLDPDRGCDGKGEEESSFDS